MYKAIGILGGTFDPIHLGHLRLALELSEELPLDHVRLLPCRLPVHRDAPHADAKHRLAMLESAINHENKLQVDNRELECATPSYMADTLASLQQDYPDTALCLIVGMDAFLQLESWHRFESILSQAHLVIAKRIGYKLPSEGSLAKILQTRLTDEPKDLITELSGKIILHESTPLAISATYIRQCLAQGRSIRYLVPESVRAYIETHQLYLRSGEGERERG